MYLPLGQKYNCSFQLSKPQLAKIHWAGLGRNFKGTPPRKDKTVLEVWKEALKKGKGVVRDPTTHVPLDPPYYNEKGNLVHDWDMAYKFDHEWWRVEKMIEAGLITPEQAAVNPSHYRPEERLENQGHEHESKNVWELPGGFIIGKVSGP